MGLAAPYLKKVDILPGDTSGLLQRACTRKKTGSNPAASINDFFPRRSASALGMISEWETMPVLLDLPEPEAPEPPPEQPKLNYSCAESLAHASVAPKDSS